jgi:flagellar hook assembly protein FlgD
VDNDLLPSNFIVNGMYPNPFNSNLAIEFSLQQESTITLTALDILGRVVDFRELGIYSPGTHYISWNGKDHVAGVYFMQLTVGQKTHVQKVIYLK